MQKSPLKPQMASMMHTCVGFVGGPSGLFGLINKLYSLFRRIFKIQGGRKWPNCLIFLPLGGPKNEFFDVKCCGPLFKNVLPTAARSICLQNRVKVLQKISPKQTGRTRKWVGVGGLSGLIGPKIKLYSFFRRIFKTRWSKAAAADPGGWLPRGSGLSLLEVSNL